MNIPIALTVAGSDSSGGAGIQADLRTFSRLKAHGFSVITAVTAQNTSGIRGIHEIPADFVCLQIDAVLADSLPGAMKTGMLLSAATVEALAKVIAKARIPAVVDPVLVSTSGTPLLHADGVDAYKRALIPSAVLITPNLAEAETLTGQRVRGIEEMEQAARRLYEMGAQHVLVKGGHLSGDAVDVFFDGMQVTTYSRQRISGVDVHGTGCVLSAAITAYLAHGRAVVDAVALGKEFITEAIRNGLQVGTGASVLLS